MDHSLEDEQNSAYFMIFRTRDSKTGLTLHRNTIVHTFLVVN